jgi:hypothetical protein
MNKPFILLIALFFGSCSLLMPNDSLYDRMANERQHYSFFNPQDDFDVVAGDKNRFEWEDDSQRLGNLNEKKNKTLEEELYYLENIQSDEEYDFYKRVSPKLGSTSEKIYYLRLQPSSRRVYASSKGLKIGQRVAFENDSYNPLMLDSRDPNQLISTPDVQGVPINSAPINRAPANYSDQQDANFSGSFESFESKLSQYQPRISQIQLYQGMTKPQVINAMGHPDFQEYAGNPRLENEKWTYQSEGQRRELYFEGGRLDGWID